ncbi:MAG: hypothetical protein ACHQYR_03900 [Candidatus Gagatemarchaeaceae archaeon]
MNTKSLAIATTVGAVAIVALLFAYPAMAASVVPGSQNPNTQLLSQQPQDKTLPKFQLSTGQTFTLTSVAGGYHQVGDKSVNGTASGSLTVKVTGTFTGGYALSITGGSVSFNGTTYTVSSGSAELGRHGVYMVGQGQLGSSGQFLFEGRNIGRFGSADYGVLRIDLTNGAQEFGLRLLVTISS